MHRFPSSRTPNAVDFDRLATIRFPLIVLLVFLHADRGGEFSARLHGAPWAAATVELLSYGLGGIRVPAFFLIGGFVFFRAVQPSAQWFGTKIAARARSLLVPLLAWNAIGLACLALAQNIPPLAGFITPSSGWATPIADFSPHQLADALLGTRHSQPFIYPLWFLRDLFLLVLLSPVVYGLVRATRGAATLVVAAAWLAGMHNMLVADDALFFFVLGAHAAIGRRSLFTFDALGPVAAGVWLALHLAGVDEPFALPLAHQAQALCGVVAVLWASGLLVRHAPVRRWARRTAHYSFFVFVAHEPLLTFARKAAFRLMQPDSPLELLLVYAGVAFGVVVLLVAVCTLAGQAMPRTLSLLTGGRSRPAPTAAPAAPHALAPALRSEFDRLL